MLVLFVLTTRRPSLHCLSVLHQSSSGLVRVSTRFERGQCTRLFVPSASTERSHSRTDFGLVALEQSPSPSLLCHPTSLGTMSVVNGSRTKRSPWFKYTIFAAIGTMFILLTTHSSSPAAFAIAAARERVSAYLPNKSGSETVMTEADFQDPLDWRDYLERTTSPLRQIEHHRTFGFSHIYVLSLPTRLDRRQEMSKLASALGIKITFVDAAHRDEQFLKWIGERVMESRELRRQVMVRECV